jgi:hypothetical protein
MSQETVAPVLSVIGNSGVRVESVKPDDHNRTITIHVDEPDELVRNAAQRLAQRVAPPGWTVRVECDRERTGPVALPESVAPVERRAIEEAATAAGRIMKGAKHGT